MNRGDFFGNKSCLVGYVCVEFLGDYPKFPKKIVDRLE